MPKNPVKIGPCFAQLINQKFIFIVDFPIALNRDLYKLHNKNIFVFIRVVNKTEMSIDICIYTPRKNVTLIFKNSISTYKLIFFTKYNKRIIKIHKYSTKLQLSRQIRNIIYYNLNFCLVTASSSYYYFIFFSLFDGFCCDLS